MINKLHIKGTGLKTGIFEMSCPEPDFQPAAAPASGPICFPSGQKNRLLFGPGGVGDGPRPSLNKYLPVPEILFYLSTLLFFCNVLYAEARLGEILEKIPANLAAKEFLDGELRKYDSYEKCPDKNIKALFKGKKGDLKLTNKSIGKLFKNQQAFSAAKREDNFQSLAEARLGEMLGKKRKICVFQKNLLKHYPKA